MAQVNVKWMALLLAAGAGWFVWDSSRNSAEARVERVAPTPVAAAASKPTDSVEPTDPVRANREKALRYVPGAGDEIELEQFWESCSVLEGERLVAVAAELEARVGFFEAMRSHMPLDESKLPDLDAPWTQRDFFALYHTIGLDEARFLLSECVAGRLREAPFYPVPSTVLDTSHPISQLVPHESVILNAAFVARLDEPVDPKLYADRPMIYAIAQKVIGSSGGGAALQLETRESLRRDRDG